MRSSPTAPKALRPWRYSRQPVAAAAVPAGSPRGTDSRHSACEEGFECWHITQGDRAAREALSIAARASEIEVREAALLALASLGVDRPSFTGQLPHQREMNHPATRARHRSTGHPGSRGCHGCARWNGTPAIRAALHQIFRRDPESSGSAMQPWFGPEAAGIPPNVCAGIALALRNLPIITRDQTLRCALRCSAWICIAMAMIRALASAPEVQGADRWLAFQAREAPEWMIRRRQCRAR